MSAVFKHNGEFQVRQVIGGYDKNFLHIVTCLKTGSSLLVDAPVKLSEFTHDFTDIPGAIFITHSHGDHIAFLDQYRSAFEGIQVIAGISTLLPENEDVIKLPEEGGFKVGQLQVKLIGTPGHYPDSVCFLIGDALFTGDTLFIGRTGRTVSTGSSVLDLYDSIYGKLMLLDRHVMIYPGHDYGPRTRMTLEKNISISPLLQAVSPEDFKERMKTFEKERIK